MRCRVLWCAVSVNLVLRTREMEHSVRWLCGEITFLYPCPVRRGQYTPPVGESHASPAEKDPGGLPLLSPSYPRRTANATENYRHISEGTTGKPRAVKVAGCV